MSLELDFDKDLREITFLIVDDNVPILNLYNSILLSFGAEIVYKAKNRHEAFEMFCDINPDIVISDFSMEPIDGFELTGHIRSNPQSPNPSVPIILVTSHSERCRVVKARDVGVTEYLVKPVNRENLYSRVKHVLSHPRMFIESDTYTGPDRRRIEDDDYEGALRRQNDFFKES